MTGAVYQLAQKVAQGSRDSGAEVRLRKVAELIPDSVVSTNSAMNDAHEAQKAVPLATLEDLTWADGVVFGSPTRYGNITAQLKNFMDQTGALWAQGQLVGKAVGFFTGAATMHGGHETTILTMSTFAYHHGMIIVPASYAIPEVSSTTTGGSPYGPSELGNKPELSQDEIAVAVAYGRRMAEISAKLKA
ncbi:MAG: NAD(P)H:quinone oxidoreductase [Thermaerobacter sp.]|nr:NAD(P)H:quinone oxidoreductase [Thermaerobacter sp.]